MDTPPSLTVISLGGGVQSSVMALMASGGAFDRVPDCAIFADTRWEPHSMVAATRLLPSGYSSDDYQYPYEWELKTDKAAYVQNELVTLTFTVTNISDWPVTLDYMPPTVTIGSIQVARDVAVLRYGDGHRVLQPGEAASFTMTWDQGAFRGRSCSSRTLRCPCTPGQPRQQLEAVFGADCL